MMSADWRALCEELVNALDAWQHGGAIAATAARRAKALPVALIEGKHGTASSG